MAKGSKGSVPQRTWIQWFFSAATARTTGWTDSIKSMFFLLIIGGIFAAIPIVTGFMTATALSYVTAYQVSMLALLALALFNYCFAAALEGLKLKALPPLQAGESNAGLDLVTMVNKLTKAAKAHEAKQASKENRKPRKFPKKITVAMFTNEHSKKVISASRLFGSCALYIPTGLLNEHSPLTEQEIGTLIMVELLKKRNARARRGFFNTCAKIGLYFMEFIENAFDSPYMLVRLFGYASGPLQFFLLYEKSCARTYHFEAMKDAIQVGGEPVRKALISAYTKIGKPTLDIGKVIPVEPEEVKPVKQKGRLKRWSRGFYNFCEARITQVGKGVNETFSDVPSAKHTMEFLNALTPSTFELREDFSDLEENDFALVEKNVIYLRKSTKKDSNELVVMLSNSNDDIFESRINIDKMPANVTDEFIQQYSEMIVAKTIKAIRKDYGIKVTLYANHDLPKVLKGLSTKPLHSHNHEHACKPPKLAKKAKVVQPQNVDNVFLFRKRTVGQAKHRRVVRR